MSRLPPVLKWPGSKWRIAGWVASFFPRHDLYVEPFGGSAAVLLAKAPARLEVYNDLDGGAVNFFRVLREPELAAELKRRLDLTPYARAEYDVAWSVQGNLSPVERAWAFFVRSHLGIGARGALQRTGFRCGVIERRPERSPAYMLTPQFFASIDKAVPAATGRLRGAVIEQNDALDVIRRYDHQKTLFYVDPPYNVRHSASYNAGVDHVELLDVLKSLAGFVVLSGYRTPLYEEGLNGWHVEERGASVFQGKRRTECLWLSPRTWEALQAERAALPESGHG